MRITDRYVLRTFVSSYVPLALAFALFFVITDAFQRLDRFLKSDAGLLRVMLEYYASTLPVVFLRFGSFVTLAAGMFAVARLQRGNELLPIKACGISAHRALLPLFFCAAGLAGVAAADAEVLIPRIAPEIREASRYHKGKEVTPGLLRDRAGNTLYAARYRPDARTLEWVTFRVRGAEGGEGVVYFADRARWEGGDRKGRWVLEVGVVRDLGSGTGTGTERPRIPQRRFGSGPDGAPIETSIIPIDVESLAEPQSLLPFRELRDQYLRQRYLPKLRVQLHERITGPLAHILLLLVGLPFVLREGSGRAAVFVGMLALIVISAGYFVVGFVFHAAGAQGALAPFPAAWAPVILFGVLGIVLFDRVRT